MVVHSHIHTQETEIMNESKLKILFSASTVVCNGNVKWNKMCLKLRGSNWVWPKTGLMLSLFNDHKRKLHQTKLNTCISFSGLEEMSTLTRLHSFVRLLHAEDFYQLCAPNAKEQNRGNVTKRKKTSKHKLHLICHKM